MTIIRSRLSPSHQQEDVMPDPTVMSYPEMFFRYEYGETKDLIIAFLTLLSGILVFSLTFAEKIVVINQSSAIARSLLITAWSCFILSIILCGLALCLISASAWMMIYGHVLFIDVPGGTLAIASWTLVIGAGLSFVLGLCLLIVAAADSMRARDQVL
jgi:hypothetical protein